MVKLRVISIRGEERNGDTTNSRRVRAYLKLLRWSGLRAGDAACLPKSRLRDDDSLFLYLREEAPRTALSFHLRANDIFLLHRFRSSCSKMLAEIWVFVRDRADIRGDA